MPRKARWRALAQAGLMVCLTSGCAKKIEAPSAGAIVAAAPVAPLTIVGTARCETRDDLGGDDELLVPSNNRRARRLSSRRIPRVSVTANKLNDINQLWLIGNGIQ